MGFVGIIAVVSSPIPLSVSAQQPTGSIPTVTGTPSGMIVSVNLDIDTVSSLFRPKLLFISSNWRFAQGTGSASFWYLRRW
jgi:hypothetical protein